MANIVRFEVLHYKVGTSDKLYELRLLKESGGSRDYYTVTASYGRRGSVLKELTKVRKTSREEAERVYDHARKEKIDKGYNNVTNKNKPKPKVVEPEVLKGPQPDRELIFGDL